MRKKYILAKRFMEFCAIFPIKRKVVFQSYFGDHYNCSPKAIFEKMRDLLPDCEYVWLLKDDSIQIPGAKVVRPDTWSALYHLATAAIWVDNARKPIWTVKRAGKQFYVHTDHAAFAIKKGEGAVEEKLNRAYVARAKHDSAMIDLLLSASRWQSETIYRRVFWYDGEIMECGLPRSDVFFGDGIAEQRRVREFYGLAEDVKLALYAPTFRNSADLSMYLTTEDCDRVRKALCARFGGEWKLLVRLHPNMMDKQERIQYSDHILNGSAYDEINDLIMASELLITDYSSCSYDAMEAGKNVLIYATDVDEYAEERGFYFTMDELPFPWAADIDGFLRRIEEFDEELYRLRAREFADGYGSFNNPNASRMVAEHLIEKLNSKFWKM